MGCLTPEQIELLAHDQAQLSEGNEFRAHIERCVDCRRRLDDWLAHEELAQKLRRMGAAEMLDRLGGPRDERTATAASKSSTLRAPDPTRSAASKATTDRVRPLPPAHEFPGYEILDEISSGGQGIVYRAYQLGTKREVAIKVLRDGSHASEEARRRFEREIEMVGQLSHPNIVAVFQPGMTSSGLHYCAMDYVAGLPLHRYVQESQLVLEDVLGLFATICEAVQYAHQRGIIHRDLKPPNILVDTDGRPRILDFGLARQVTLTDKDLTATGQVVGTLPYLSPEQARGDHKQINTLTDVYALGVILYRLLAGQFPYPVDCTQWEVINHILNTPPTSLTRSWSPDSGVTLRYGRRPSCPIDKDIETIVLKALQKEQARRYQSAGELARDIRHYLASEPIEARRDSSWYVMRKLARRHVYAITTVIGVAVILVSSAAIAAEFYLREKGALGLLGLERKNVALTPTVEADAAAIRDAVRRQTLGWFLMEWHAGRLGRAREIRETVGDGIPEAEVMDCLLDQSCRIDDLAAALPVDYEFLARFAEGERLLKAGCDEEALAAFESALAEVGVSGKTFGWWKQTLRSRVQQLRQLATESERSGD